MTVLLRLAYLTVSNAFAVLRLLPASDKAGIDPAPGRSATTWAGFLRAQAEDLLGCDFFETVALSGGGRSCSR